MSARFLRLAAMAQGLASFAVASLRAKAPIELLDVANVAMSFPGFVDLARSAGLRITASA